MGEDLKETVAGSALESANEIGQEVSALSAYIEAHIPNLIELGVRLLIVILVFFVGRFLIRWIRRRMKKFFERTNADTGVAQFTDSLLKFGLYFLLAMIIARNLGVELSSLTALFAGAGVGVTMALQGTLSNFAGGVLILILKPFKVGDYIIEDTNKDEGTVKEIQMFHTKLTTVDNKTIVIPNGMLTNNSLTNVTAKDERQLDLRISISYGADLKKAKGLLEDMLVQNPKIMTDTEEWRVFVDSLADSAVVLGVRAWVRTEEYWPVRWELLEQIKLTFDEEEIEIPYPQMSVYVRENKVTAHWMGDSSDRSGR